MSKKNRQKDPAKIAAKAARHNKHRAARIAERGEPKQVDRPRQPRFL